MTAPPDESRNLKVRPNRTFICSVVFIDIVEYTKKPVNEQIRLKERFNALLTEAIRDISINDRIILDTGDGAAVGFLGDPEDALFVAMSLRDSLKDDRSEATSDLQVRMGVNLGPVKLLKDINNQLNLIGDGINVSQRIMSFAEPGQLLVSRSYFDIVSCLSQEYAKLFQYQGARADKHIREHDIYAVEHMGANPITVKDKQIKKPGTPFSEDAAVAPEKPATKTSAGAGPETAAQPAKPDKNIKMLIIGGALAAAIIAIIALIIIPKGKAPVDGTKGVTQSNSAATSTSSKAFVAAEAPVSVTKTTNDERALKTKARPLKTHPAATSSAKTSKAETPSVSVTKTTNGERALETKTQPSSRTFSAVSAEARDILFTVTGLESSGSEITVTLKAHNKSSVVRSVALYDDSYSWPKSMMTDDNGKQHNVNRVSFVKGSERIAMSEAGTEGIHVAPGESVTTFLTFKKDGNVIRTLNLHPFIYQGRRDWKEYDLTLNLRS
jgi:class 3 adenylate cyclase